MIAATPPAYYETIGVTEIQARPHGASDDSVQIEEFSLRALRHLISTPRHLLETVDETDDYQLPQPASVSTKRVRFRYMGPGQPIPLDQDMDER